LYPCVLTSFSCDRLPLYPLVCNRKIMRKHVEDAVEACGIEEFVNVNLKEDLKERIDALVTEMQV
jgi:hypothetical protein